MLDGLSISTRSGLVLWSKSYTAAPPSSSSSSTGSSASFQGSTNNATSPLNSLIQEVLLDSTNERTVAGNRFDKDNQSLMWTLANDLGLIFVVVWPRILHLTYLEKLLESMKTLFISMYGDTVRSITSGERRQVLSPQEWAGMWKGWDAVVSRLVRELEEQAAKNSRKGAGGSSKTRGGGIQPNNGVGSEGSTPGGSDRDEATTPTLSPDRGQVTDAETIARNIAALKARNRARLSPSPRALGGKKKTATGSASEASDAEGTPKKATPTKVARKWEDSGKINAKDMQSLDFSSQEAGQDSDAALDTLVDENALGKRGANGLYEVADYSDRRDDDGEADSILASLAAVQLQGKEDPQGNAPTSKPSAFSSFFSKLSTSAGLASKTLTEADLQPVLNAMREHLMTKNVARDIADKICDAVGQSLIGKTTSGFGDGGVRAEVRRALEEALTRILTSKTSTDILLDITRKKQLALRDGGKKEPYTITFVGVNGVGKSTNLSKVAFWLLQNRMRVLIAACDTFRSGAVEQLRTHVRNLGKLKVIHDDGYPAGSDDKTDGRIELFEKGYGKDAAGIAKDAINYAKDNSFDVVLIDTAGRMQDNEPLMRALAKLVSVNNPDKIFFVGEAVVGNEAVDQLTKFNRSLRDFSGLSNAKARGIDGMILTKMDIIDDKVGAALSMTYVTGQPIVFIGTGQTYTDLKAMRVGHVVNALMRN